MHEDDDSLAPTIVRVNGRTQTVYEGQAHAGRRRRRPRRHRRRYQTVAGMTFAERNAAGYTVTPTDRVVGYTYADPRTGQVSYGVYQPDGSLRFTQENPWANGIIDNGDTSLVIGNPTTTPDGTATITVGDPANLRPGANVAGFSPVPLDTNISEAEARRELDKQNARKAGDAYKAQEYVDYLHDKLSQPQQPAPPYAHDTSGREQSPASAALTATLNGVGQAIQPYLMPTPLSGNTPGSFGPPRGVTFGPPPPPPTPRVVGGSAPRTPGRPT
jgi:hypothetical protein